jgi:hypothetical protein
MNMIESEEHKANLIQIAENLRRIQQGIPTDKDGNPSETFLEYLSLMYNAEAAELVKHLPVMPLGMTTRKLAHP